jgi:hypothetical protein
MPRTGTSVLTFSTLTLYSSELIETNFDQSISITSHSTLPNITLSQPGSIGLGEIEVKAIITSEVQTLLPQIHGLFNNRQMAALTIIGVSYGNYYFNKLNYLIDSTDELRRPLRLEISLGFTQAIETYV